MLIVLAGLPGTGKSTIAAQIASELAATHASVDDVESAMLAAGIDDLQVVDGVGETRARSVREGLSRLAETSILERYV